MVVKEKLRQDFDQAFLLLQNNLNDSLEIMKNNPAEKEEVINMWKTYLRRFVNEATGQSEKYRNRDLIKAITKMFIFGR